MVVLDATQIGGTALLGSPYAQGAPALKIIPKRYLGVHQWLSPIATKDLKEQIIVLLALISVHSLASAVSVDYYPHHDHHNHHDPHHVHHHPGHVKYIEPNHVNAVKYVHPGHPVAPVYKSIPAAPVKYIHQEPQPVKYIENPHYAKHVEYDTPPQYEYGYDVHDPHTGDVKSHSEKRDGDAVHGRYEVLDPDGFKRIVEYTADDHNGFNAVVTRVPSDVKIEKKEYEPQLVKHVPAPLPVPVQAPVKYYHQPQAVVQPALKYFAQPVHQKIVAPVPAPIVKHLPPPTYYAPPEHPKFFKPVEKYTKFVKPAYDYEPHHDVKYVQPAPHYAHYQ